MTNSPMKSIVPGQKTPPAVSAPPAFKEKSVTARARLARAQEAFSKRQEAERQALYSESRG